MEGFLQKLTAAAQKIADKVVDAAPEAWELVLAATRIEGIRQIALGAVMILLAVGLIYSAFRLYWWCEETDRWLIKRQFGSGKTAGPWLIPVALFGLGGSALSIVGSIKLINIWYWAAIFYPKIYIAHKALESVGAQ